MPSIRLPLTCFAIMFAALVWSGIGPADRLTWVMETLPVMLALPLLALTLQRFRLSGLAYGLIALHAVILVIGGHYTYAEVPAGFAVQDWFDLSRNPYDRLGDLAQGFIPAMQAATATTTPRPSPMGG